MTKYPLKHRTGSDNLPGKTFVDFAEKSPPLQEKKILEISEKRWNNIVENLVTMQGEPDKTETHIRIRWDNSGLTVEFNCTDDNVVASDRKRGDMRLWMDDNVEVFVDPGHTHDATSRWFHVLLSANGAIYEEWGPNQNIPVEFNASNLVTRAERTAEGWLARLTIPWETLGRRPEPGDAWGFNVNRTEQPAGCFLCWSPTFGTFSQIHQWGHLVFLAGEANDTERAAAGHQKIADQHRQYLNEFDQIQAVIKGITGGGGLLSGQKKEPTESERELRDRAEARITKLLANWSFPKERQIFTPERTARIRANVAGTMWGKAWFEKICSMADHVTNQPASYIEEMISELTPAYTSVFNCPACIGNKSIEGVGTGGSTWDYRKPNQIACSSCGQTYPDVQFAETGILQCPRRNQVFTYYLNDAERRHPADRSGHYAWKWGGQPVHVSFSGIVRFRRACFMISATRELAIAFLVTGEESYARTAHRILLRLAECYPKWIYHDYHDTFADCDPLYAAHNTGNLPLAWKRNASEGAYRAATTLIKHEDTLEKAALQGLWGGGRIIANVDGASLIGPSLASALDILGRCEIREEPLFTTDERERIIRDLLLEHLFTIEPFVGPPGQGVAKNNKSPYAYNSFIMIGRILNLPVFVDVGLQGFQNIVESCFCDDGFSRESPAYTHMYLKGILPMAEALDGYVWPEEYAKRSGRLNMFGPESKARKMLKTQAEALCANQLAPMGDTLSGSRLDQTDISRIAKYVGPEALPDAEAALQQEAGLFYEVPQTRGEWDVFHHTPGKTEEDERAESSVTISHPLTGLDGDVYYPDYRLPLLRHGRGTTQSVFMMTLNCGGLHQHNNSLGIWWMDRGRPIIGEMGYVGDTAIIKWGSKPEAHNLVFVDNASPGKNTDIHMLLTAGPVSAVEAMAIPFGNCRQQKRLVLLFRGPQHRTFLVEVSRVQGGAKHTWRLWSELAASNAKDAVFCVEGSALPPLPPHPDFGGSMKSEHVNALHATIHGGAAPAGWNAIWREQGRAYRLTHLTPADAIEVHSAPGLQHRNRDIGRRVRMLDAIHQGDDLTSRFVVIHETADDGEAFPVKSAKLLPVPDAAGGGALAIELDTTWYGRVRILSDFVKPTTIGNIVFHGQLGVWAEEADGCGWSTSVGSGTLTDGQHGHTGATSEWNGAVVDADQDGFTAGSPRPEDWPIDGIQVVPYVLVTQNDEEGSVRTYRAASGATPRISIPDHPFHGGTRFKMPRMEFEKWGKTD